MSRVDEAWKRASNAATPAADSAVFTPAWDVVDDAPSSATTAAERVVEHRAVPPRRAGIVERLVGTGRSSTIANGQYSALAAGLLQARRARTLQTVMIASAAAGEGKSLTAANLALTFSRFYHQSVVLVDADLKRPTLHTILGVENLTGLHESLTLGGRVHLMTQPVSDCLALMSAGRPEPDPTALLTSERMRTILRELSDRFAWVIVDAPPVASLPDASLLSGMVDAVLLVVRAAHTPLRLVESAVRSLGRDRILGMVLNQVEEPRVPAGRGRTNQERE
jgi:capsular exopolysaccharide synthesis family protein